MKIFVPNPENSRKYFFKTIKCFITHKKLNTDEKWICPCESWGPEDFKTGILFKNWPNMKPLPSKTRNMEKTEYPLWISAMGERNDTFQH